MQFTSFLEDGRLTVALTGEIDHHCAKHYIKAIGAKIDSYTPEECILDFSEVSFMDSSGLAVVINALRGMTQKELAEKTGIRPPTVSAICVGTVKHLPVDALEKICDVLDCQPADLMEFVRDSEDEG